MSAPYPSSVAHSEYNRLVQEMQIWKEKYFIDNGSRTSELQKGTLQILLRDPDQDLYELDRYGTVCPFCAPREGRVYSRSGMDPDFPPLAFAFQKIDKNGPDVLWNTYLVTHPNTRHGIIPWTSAGLTEEELEKIKQFSSPITNPFSHDPRVPKQIAAYKKNRDGRQKWLRDYHLFEICRSLNIEKFPKTFQTFEKHKQANSEKYQEWMRQYSIIKNNPFKISGTDTGYP